MIDHIIYHKSELFYYREGSGDKTILLFHGFGQDHVAFDSWIDALENDYTIFVFDLFFHGNSRWENQYALGKDDWKKILQLFLIQEKIGDFDIAGFSIGAKFAFTTFELFPERVKKIILLAPDGISNNFWYSLATRTSLMRSLFRSLVLKPRRLNALLKFLKAFRLEDKNLLRFAEFQLSTEEKRQRVYKSWIYFRHLNLNLSDLALIMNSKNIPVIFILGRSDRIIPSEKVNAFAKTLKNYQFQLLDAGHHDLIETGSFLIKQNK